MPVYDAACLGCRQVALLRGKGRDGRGNAGKRKDSL
jgi:hypothetical protein